jgi:hypothetical protein
MLVGEVNQLKRNQNAVVTHDGWPNALYLLSTAWCKSVKFVAACVAFTASDNAT